MVIALLSQKTTNNLSMRSLAAYKFHLTINLKVNNFHHLLIKPYNLVLDPFSIVLARVLRG